MNKNISIIDLYAEKYNKTQQQKPININTIDTTNKPILTHEVHKKSVWKIVVQNLKYLKDYIRGFYIK